MEKIFTMDVGRFPTSLDAVGYILQNYFGQAHPTFARTEHGKPYLTNLATPLFFSVSHTQNRLFVAISDENVGLDTEVLSRQARYDALLKRFSNAERAEITSDGEFLRHWTVKESVVKWLGGTLAHDLKKLSYIHNEVFYEEKPISARITVKEWEGFLLSVCCVRDFSHVNVYSIP